MLAADKHADILNELVRINNDRIAGYETALKELPEEEVTLRTLFRNNITESVSFRESLIAAVARLGEKVAGDSTISGKLYRTWMDLKTTFTGTDRKAILESCAFGEDAWQKAYENVLGTESGLPEESQQLITRQYNTCRQSADLVKKYRDAYAGA